MNNIVLYGDTHGFWSRMSNRIRQNHENSYIIHVGDFGVVDEDRIESYYLESLQKALEKKNCFLYVIRGNHDNPNRFLKTHHPYGFSNILFLPDYTELNLLGKKILLVGGGISVDRYKRTEGEDYWKDEKFKFDPNYEYINYDLVVTHIKPRSCNCKKGYKDIQYHIDQDINLLRDLIEESEEADKLYQKTKPADWIFGHYHLSFTEKFEDTIFKCLNVDEDYLYYSTKPPFQ
jgi:predicted phosphodiesterase